MRIKTSYLKNLLTQILNCKEAFFTVREFSQYREIEEKMKKGKVKDDEFVFHMMILKDLNVIEGGEIEYDIGIKVSLRADGEPGFMYSIDPNKILRMTAYGHQYAIKMLQKKSNIVDL